MHLELPTSWIPKGSICRFLTSTTLQEEGGVFASLWVNGLLVRRWDISVLPGKAYVSNTIVKHIVSPVRAGETAEIRVQLRDMYGNAIPSTLPADFNGSALNGPVNIEAATGNMRYLLHAYCSRHYLFLQT